VPQLELRCHTHQSTTNSLSQVWRQDERARFSDIASQHRHVQGREAGCACGSVTSLISVVVHHVPQGTCVQCWSCVRTPRMLQREFAGIARLCHPYGARQSADDLYVRSSRQPVFGLRCLLHLLMMRQHVWHSCFTASTWQFPGASTPAMSSTLL